MDQHQYELVIHQPTPTGCTINIPIKLWDKTRLDDHIAMHLDAYCIAYNYDGPVHVTVYEKQTTLTVIKEEIYP